jgi:hypothetical protein
LEYKERAREVGDSNSSGVNRSFLRYRTLRALGFLTLRHPGVPLRSTPGFMLAPAARVLEKYARIKLFRAFSHCGAQTEIVIFVVAFWLVQA